MFGGENLLCLRGGRVVFAELSFTVARGGALILRGPNGSGKSSLLRIAASLMQAAAGSLLWDKEPIDIDSHRARLTYVGHNDAIKPVFSVRENLEFWAAYTGRSDDAAQRVEHALAMFGLDRLADIPARFLSAGERRRLGLARLGVADGPLWLLDEPTVALDRESVSRFTDALRQHLDRDGLAIVATHIDIDIPNAKILELTRSHAAKVA
jgi:heme exporter protein A